LAGSQDLLDHTTTDGSNGDGSLPDESVTIKYVCYFVTFYSLLFYLFSANPSSGNTNAIHHNGDAASR
jgi:hypothetical protein